MIRIAPATGLDLKSYDASKPSVLKQVFRYVLAVLMVAVTLWIRLEWDDNFENRPIISLLFLPIALSAYFLGFGPGILATGLSVLGSNYLLFPPLYSFRLENGLDVFQVCSLAGMGCLITSLIEAARSAGRKLAAAEWAARRDVKVRFLLDNMMEGCLIINHDWRIHYLNQAGSLFCRKLESELLGRPIAEVFPELRQTAMYAVLDRCMQERTQAETESELVYRNGERATFLLLVKPIQEGILLFLLNITKRKQAETALMESQERLNLALKASTTGVWQWDFKSDEVFWSPECYSIFAVSSTDVKLTATWYFSMVHPEDLKVLQSSLQRALAEKVAFQYEYRVCQPDGSERWVSNLGLGKYDESGQLLRVIGTVMDIHERKQAQLALQESEARLRALVDNLPGGMVYQVLKELDGQERFVHVSAGVERINGLKPEQVLANPQSFYDQMLPEDQARLRVAQVVSEQTMGLLDVEVRCQPSQGRLRWVRLMSVPRQLPDGRQVWDGLELDITERKHHEMEQAQLVAIVQSTNDAIISADLNGTITSWNRGAELLFGWTVREVVGRSLLITVPPERAGEWPRILGAVAQGQGLSQFETVRISKDGHRHQVSLTISPIHDSEGRIIGSSMIAADIGTRKQAEIELRESERRWRFALEVAGDGLWDWNVQTREFHLSRQWKAMIGCEDHEVGNHLEDWEKHIHSEDRPKIDQIVREHFAGVKPLCLCEYRFLCKDGTYRWILSRGKLIAWTQSGKPLRVIGTHTDITEHKRMLEAHQLMVSRLLESESIERRRIARELHDTTAQHLVALKMNLVRCKPSPILDAQLQNTLITDCLKLVEQAVQEIRTLTYVLHPPLLDDLGLPSAVSDYAYGVGKRSGVHINLDTEGYRTGLPYSTELTLFRVIQESLNNAIRHSGSADVTIRLEHDDREARLEVQDSGQGFSPMLMGADPHRMRASGVGIPSMRERLQMVGGSLTIESDTCGVTVLATIPLAELPKEASVSCE